MKKNVKKEKETKLTAKQKEIIFTIIVLMLSVVIGVYLGYVIFNYFHY